MAYSFTISHSSPSLAQFAEWNVKEAFPVIYVTIEFASHNTNLEPNWAEVQVEIKGHYYCSGSRNMELESISVCDADNMTPVVAESMCVDSLAVMLQGLLIQPFAEEIVECVRASY